MLAFTVPTFPGGGTAYPSVNVLIGQLKGKKSPEYHDLRVAVREGARKAMEATGWVTATYYVDVFWKRYVTSMRGFDPMNATKCEFDAMEPDAESDFPGVYTRDSLVIPHVDTPQFDPDPGAIDRIAIAVFRLFPRILDADRSKTKTKAAKRVITPPPIVLRASAPAGPMPTLNGKPIAMADALALIGREDKRR